MDELLSRDKVEEKYKWDLTKFFANDEEWHKCFEQVKNVFSQIDKYIGKLNNKETLMEYLKFCEDFEDKLDNLAIYVSCNENSDLSNSKYTEMSGLLDSFFAKMMEKMSFFTPEMLNYGDDYLKSLIEDKRFADYKFSFEQLLREKAHTLSKEEERIISKTAMFSGSASDILSTYLSVDFKSDKAIDSNGNSYDINDATYGSLLMSSDRALRESAYKNYNTALSGISNTIAKNFIASLREDCFYAQVHNFKDTLEAKLYGDNMDKSTYDRLIKNAHSRLDIVGRYHIAKKQSLNYSTLYMWDRLCSMVSENEEKYPFEKCCDILSKAFLPLGQEYIDCFNNAVKERWFDVFPSKGKRGGAYENAIYGKTPIVLLNHTNDYNSLSTIAHEFGHAMHSYYSDKNQPREMSQYTIFCAEIASITNEILLSQYLLNNTPIEKKKERLFYLNQLVSEFISTFFRQTMFAEFEEYAHSLVDYDKPISREILNKKYQELNEKYLPEMSISDLNESAWIAIPHFYNDYYVWQYATGIVCAINFASSILNNEPNALENYRKFLSSGRSDYSLNILKSCGIDLNTDKPYEVAFDFIDKNLKEMEDICSKKH